VDAHGPRRYNSHPVRRTIRIGALVSIGAALAAAAAANWRWADEGPARTRAIAHRLAGAPPNRWGGPILPAPIVSRGKRVASLPRGAAPVVDGVYRSGKSWAGGFPTSEKPSWVAIRVGAGYSRLLLSWTSSGNHDYYDTFYGAPADYRIETSADSTDGADGTWHTVAAVAGNPVRTRAHAFDFAGERWVRMVVTRLPEKVNPWGLFIDEIDVHDLSAGGNDVWVFLGDSITAGVFDRASEHRPSFADDVARQRSGYLPAMIDAGLCRARTADALARIDEILALNPDARVFAIEIGSNDGTPEMVRESLVPLVRRIRAAGKIPVVARISYRTGIPQDWVAPKNAVVDEVVRDEGLLAGPDLYAWFKAHPARLADGLHPDDAGAVATSRLWAEAVAPLYEPGGADPSRVAGH
jgi:acyl-CoA thioesterase I